VAYFYSFLKENYRSGSPRRFTVYYHLGNVDEKYWVLSKDVSYSCIYSTRHHMGVISKITLEGGRSFEGSIY
jgi:hypothetical protein